MDTRAFYDSYVERQLRTGVNERHRRIQAWLVRFGMRKDARVLEIGSGIGAQTGLLASYLRPGGAVVSLEPSERSVAAARVRLEGERHIEIRSGDILELDPATLSPPFDVVLLGDVIEHIPLASHGELFARVRACLRTGGFCLVHIPNPYHLAWCIEHEPELLQPIDQPVYTDQLLPHVYAAGMHLHHLETYPIWVGEADYQVLVLRPTDPGASFRRLPEPGTLRSRVRRRLRRLLGR